MAAELVSRAPITSVMYDRVRGSWERCSPSSRMRASISGSEGGAAGGSPSPNTNIVPPAEFTILCSPSISYDIGALRTAAPAWKCQSGSPVSALSAKKFPSSLPPKTRLPAVAITPAQGGDCSGNSHFSAPVRTSSALIAPLASSPRSACSPPPMKGWPGTYSTSAL